MLACDGGCSACGDDALAELTEASGEITRDHDASREQWQEAPVGAEFFLGDAVRTGGSATASVTLASGGGIQLVPETIVRFLANRPDDPSRQVAVELGEVDLTAGEGGISVVGQFGAAVLEPGGRMRVNAAEGQLELEVLIGSARIEREGEEAIELGAGEELVIDIELGDPIFEEDPDAGPPDAGPPDAGPPDAGAEPTAEISVRVRGRVERMNEDGEWERLDRRTDSLPARSRLRLARRARLSLSRGDESLTLFGEGEATVGAEGGALAQLGSGRASLSADDQDVVLAVPGGAVVGRGGAGASRVDVRLRGDAAVVSVQRGSAELRGTEDTHTLRTGQNGTLLANGTVDSASRPPARAHMAIQAGGSATIHDPQTPVAVRIQFGSVCPGEGLVELAGGSSFRRPAMRSSGAGAANIAVSPGSNRYRVRCSTGGTPGEAIAASGSLTVRRDTGRQQLPRRPPRNVVDTDGRRYTVLYQNLLPIVTVRWAGAPSAGSYVLHFAPSGGEARTLRGQSPSATLESGTVPEGTHRLWFEAPGGSPSRSPQTTLSVRFDNAASAAFVREPAPGGAISGSVRVSGVAVSGSTVSVGGVELPLDRQFRFSGAVSAPEGLDALAIKIVHPRSGVHYYLRRVARR